MELQDQIYVISGVFGGVSLILIILVIILFYLVVNLIKEQSQTNDNRR